MVVLQESQNIQYNLKSGIYHYMMTRKRQSQYDFLLEAHYYENAEYSDILKGMISRAVTEDSTYSLMII